MLPRQNYKICAVKLVQSQGNPLHYRAQNYRRLILGCQKGKNCRESTEKRQKIALKRLVQQKTVKSHATRLVKVSKTGRILSENGRPEIFAENGGFSAETEGLESLRNKL